jgi:hypothetical protein
MSAKLGVSDGHLVIIVPLFKGLDDFSRRIELSLCLTRLVATIQCDGIEYTSSFYPLHLFTVCPKRWPITDAVTLVEAKA